MQEVGHAHEDIDQLFSCVSQKLNTVFMHMDLNGVIRLSFNPEPEIGGVYDVKSWMML